MHLLIITHFYPPLNTIASLRPKSFAKYFAEQGHFVTVLTTKKTGLDGDLDLEMYNHPNIKVIEVEYKKLFFWQKNNQALKKVIPGNKTSFKGKVLNLIKKSLHRLGYLIDHQKFWINKAVDIGVKLIEKEKIDIILSTFAPPAAHVVASKIIKKHPNVKWIADYRDLWSQNHLVKSTGIFKVMERMMEKSTIYKADHLTTVSKPLAQDLSELTKNKVPVSVIYNGYDTPINLKKDIDTPISVLKKPYKIVYTGIIYKDRRDPSPLFFALKELEKEGIINVGDLIVEFYGNANANLEEIIKKCNVSEWVSIKGQVSYNEALIIQRSADWLLFLESNAKDARGVLTGKLFEYMAANKPILGIGIDQDCASGQVIEETNAGSVFGTNVSLIKNYFKKTLNSEIDFKPNWSKIEEYSRSKQAEKIMGIILNLLKN